MLVLGGEKESDTSYNVKYCSNQTKYRIINFKNATQNYKGKHRACK